MAQPLRRLLALPAFAGARLVAGAGGLEAPIALVAVGEVPDGPSFLRGGELVLTTFFAQPRDVPGAVRAYREAGAAAIVYKCSDWMPRLPDAARRLADRECFPLVEVPVDRRWPHLMAACLELLHGRHRRLRLARRRASPAGPRLDALYTALDRCRELQQLAAALVAPLEAYDRQRNGQLVRTLRAYLDHRQNASATAAALYLHRNSLAYRLRQVRRLTGCDLRDPRQALAWHLALLVREESARR